MVDRPMPDEAVFRGVFGKIANELDPNTEADRVATFSVMMGFFSAAIGNTPWVRAGNSKRRLAYWPMLVGRSNGGGKGTAMGEATRIFERGVPWFVNESMSSDVPGGGASFAELLYERAGGMSVDENGEPEEVRADVTTCITDEEYANTIMTCRKDKDLAKRIRLAWEGQDQVYRTKKEMFTVERPHVIIVANLTPGELMSTVSSADVAGGSFNRFFPIYVERTSFLPFGGDLTDDQMNEWGDQVRQAVVYGSVAGHVSIDRHSDAGKLFAKAAARINTAVNENEAMEGFAGRAREYFNRLVGLYSLANFRDESTVEDVESAEALINYMLESVRYVVSGYAPGDNDETGLLEAPGVVIPDNLPQKLTDYLLENGGQVPRRQAQQMLNSSADELDEAASRTDGMVELARVAGSSGRKRYIYRYRGPVVAAAGTEAAPSTPAPVAEVPVIQEAVKVPAVPQPKKPRTRASAGNPFLI